MRPFALLLGAFFPALSSAALFLQGPPSVYPCQEAPFSWGAGSPPYTFYAVDEGSVNVFHTNYTGILAHINVRLGQSLSFHVQDQSGASSNILAYFVVSGTNMCYTDFTMEATPSAEDTAVHTIDYDSTTVPMVNVEQVAPPQDGSVVTISQHPYTASSMVSPMSPGATGAMSPPRRSIAVWIPIVATIFGLAVLSLCTIGILCWRRSHRRRRGGVYQDNAILWRWRRRRGSHRVRNKSFSGDKSATALVGDSNADLRDDLSPDSSPFQSSALMSTTPASSVPQRINQTLPSSKEMRMRPWEARNSFDGASISDVSGPISTTASTSIWPANSDTRSNVRGSEAPRDPRRPEPNSRSLQVIITRELEHILQHPQHSASFTSLNEAPPTSGAQTQDLGKSRTVDSPDEKAALSLTIPATPNSGSDSGYNLSSASALTRTPISRRDMEVLADMVAERLARDRDRDHGTDRLADAPPPSYS